MRMNKRIQIIQFKNRAAIAVETASIIATFLPDDGAKLASLRVKKSGKELLVVKPEEQYKVLEYEGDYCSSECSGFDDMFPTVDPFAFSEGPYGGITYPDHGETCRIPYTVDIEHDRVVFQAKSKLFPIEYQKTVRLTDEGELVVTYSFHNHGEHDFPFLWAGHIMLQGEDGVKVFTPFTEDTPIEMMFADGESSDENLPKDRLTEYQPGRGMTYKFYYLDTMKEGKFGLDYPDGTRLSFEVDPNKLPYLGIWLDNGKFQDLYSITPEPCTIPFDSVERAEKRGYRSVIPAGSEFIFEIKITWEDMK